jgi:hypothetical protein
MIVDSLFYSFAIDSSDTALAVPVMTGDRAAVYRVTVVSSVSSLVGLVVMVNLDQISSSSQDIIIFDFLWFASKQLTENSLFMHCLSPDM